MRYKQTRITQYFCGKKKLKRNQKLDKILLMFKTLDLN